MSLPHRWTWRRLAAAVDQNEIFIRLALLRETVA